MRRLRLLRILLSFLFGLSILMDTAFGQAIQNPNQPTNQPGQVSITTQFLYTNKMHFAGTYSAATSYNSQDLVISAGVSYVSLATNNTNNTPSSSPSFWTPLPSGGTFYQTLGIGGTSQTQRGRLNLIAGSNISLSNSDNSGTGSSDVTIVATAGGGATKLNGTATFAYGSAIQDGDCLQGGTTITVTGAALGDPVYMGTNAVLGQGVDVFGKVTATNTVTVEVCNLSGAATTPASTTYSATVIH